MGANGGASPCGFTTTGLAVSRYSAGCVSVGGSGWLFAGKSDVGGASAERGDSPARGATFATVFLFDTFVPRFLARVGVPPQAG
jgi:hypothetical protein